MLNLIREYFSSIPSNEENIFLEESSKISQVFLEFWLILICTLFNLLKKMNKLILQMCSC